MSTRNIDQKTYDEVGAAIGGAKKSGSWYVDGEETIAVLNLQKSQYSLSYYVNVCFWLRAAGPNDALRPHRCQIQTRLTGNIPVEREKYVADLLDLDRPVNEEVRREGLLMVLRDYVVPVMDLSATLDGLRSPEGQQLLKKCLIYRDGQRLLAVTHP